MTLPVASSDRNLLFGLLALQSGLVTQQQLIEALRASTSEKRHTPLGEALVRRGALDEDARAAVERLTSEHAARHGGERGALAVLRVEGDVRASLAALGGEFESALMDETLRPVT